MNGSFNIKSLDGLASQSPNHTDRQPQLHFQETPLVSSARALDRQMRDMPASFETDYGIETRTADFEPRPDFGQGMEPLHRSLNQSIGDANGSAADEFLTSLSTADQLSGGMMDISDFQLDDETCLEDVLLCQFTYNPSGLTIPSTPTAAALPAIVDVAECQDPTLPLNSNDLPNGANQKFSPGPMAALQVTPDELRLFHAKLTIADAEECLVSFKKPSLSRTLRCIIAYFRHFDPHAPFIHYASFNISTTHRE